MEIEVAIDIITSEIFFNGGTVFLLFPSLSRQVFHPVSQHVGIHLCLFLVVLHGSVSRYEVGFVGMDDTVWNDVGQTLDFEQNNPTNIKNQRFSTAQEY